MEASFRTIKLLSAFSHKVTKNNHKILFPYDPFSKYSADIKKFDDSSKTYKQIGVIESGWRNKNERGSSSSDERGSSSEPRLSNLNFSLHEGLMTVTKPSFLEKFYSGEVRDALEFNETGEFLVIIKDEWIRISEESGPESKSKHFLCSLNHQVEIFVNVSENR